jgi:hypothetical protein
MWQGLFHVSARASGVSSRREFIQAARVAVLFTSITKGYAILCYIYISRLQRAAITLCSVRNIPVHKGSEYEVCTYSVRCISKPICYKYGKLNVNYLVFLRNKCHQCNDKYKCIVVVLQISSDATRTKHYT